MNTTTLPDSTSVSSAITDGGPQGQFCTAFGTRCYRISNVHRLPPFFINLVSPTDLWMFVASNGAHVHVDLADFQRDESHETSCSNGP